MAMTATERRKKDRERKAEQRAAAKAAGVPTPELVYHSISEAVAFAMVNSDRRTWIKGTSWCPINSAVVIAVAVDILTERCGCERDAAKAAVKQALRPRDPWRYPDYIPSSNPSPGHRAYYTQAPDQVVVRSKMANTPVTSSGLIRHSSTEVSENA